MTERKRPKAGHDIVSYCGKCKMKLMHIIHAVVDDIPVRVECKTCGAIHKYKPYAPGEKKPRASRTSSGGRKTTARSSSRRKTKAEREAEERQVQYMKLLEQANDDDASPYVISKTFEEGAVLHHIKFGVGIVTKAGDRKITVLFSDAERQLVHGLDDD